MVLKRACPCSSRLVPVGAPIGFSGAFSSVGPRIFSAQTLSDSEGLRPSKTSAMGLSVTAGLVTLAFGFLSGIRSPHSFDDRGAPKQRQGNVPTERLVKRVSALR